MKKKPNISISMLLLMGVFLVFSSSCEKDADDNPTNGKSTAMFNPNVSYGKMTDQDGNVYKTVTIGTQTWMAENLRTTVYNDGTFIPNVTDNNEWSQLTTGAYCNYNNSISTDTIATYGRLYNWHAINTGKLAPVGWHIPTDDEWATLSIYLNYYSGKLKEEGTIHWTSPNTGATNETGFTALPGGGRGSDGIFFDISYKSYWLSATLYIDGPLYRCIENSSNFINSSYTHQKVGFSVRCVKD